MEEKKFKCDYKGCNRESVTVCVVQDLDGDEHNKFLCTFHMNKINKLNIE